ncbi:MAG TPA: exonuclease SbcCD subunit D [Clostridiales bacterium]|nr:exonuclease SbcCD subunit D [Clostridiales bacterium]
MRILHTSDWHLGRNLEQISRLEEQRGFIDSLVRIADKEDVDLVLVAGDIYDTYNPSAAAEELFYDAMDRLGGKSGRAVIAIAGNHDNPDRLCAASPLAYKNGIILLGYPGSDAGEYRMGAGGINITDSGPGWLELSLPRCGHNAVIITMPFPSESRLEELLSEKADEAELQNAYSEKIGSIFAGLSVKFRDDTVNLIVAHLFLLGGSTSDSERTLQVGGAMTVDPSVLPEKAHYAALGHLHRPQQIRSAPCPAYYAGSPLAYSFSEAGYSKAVNIVDAQPGEKAEVRPVYLDCGKPLIKWFANEGIQQALQWCGEGRDPNAWIDLEILTDRVLTADEYKAIRSMHPGIINIRPRIRSEETEVMSPESREGRKIDELFRDYYKYRMGVDIPDELMGAFLELLNEDSEQDDTEPGVSDDNSGQEDGDLTETVSGTDDREVETDEA